MARCENHNKYAIHNILHEQDRTASEYKNRVDLTRSHMNWYYGKTNDAGKVADAVKKRCSDIMNGRRLQDKTNIMSVWCLTYPEEYCHKEPYMGKDREGNDTVFYRNVPDDMAHCRKFFDIAYDFMCDRYGKENVISAMVHMDETTPHIHMNFVPEATSRKTGKKTVSTASLITPGELHKYHTDLDAVMEKMFGVKSMILNGRTKGNYTQDELKERTEEEERSRRRKKKLDDKEQALNDRENALDARESILNAKENEIALREQKVQEIAVKQRQRRRKLDNKEIELVEKDMKLDSRERKIRREEERQENEKRIIQERNEKSLEMFEIASTEHTWYTEQQKSRAKTVQRMALLHRMNEETDRRHQEQQNQASWKDIMPPGN